jgi:anthranilate phosphoribosyltransferase
VARCIEEAGFGFMFAPAHHQATRFVVPVRRELAVKTIFNLLGPLTNPAGAQRQLIGVSDPSFLETIAGALARLGVHRALVVAGEDGLDEVSIGAATRVVEVNGAELSQYTLTPGDVGIELATTPDYDGGTPEQNAEATRAILAGEPGQRADLALINAGAAIYAAGVVDTLADGVQAARAAVADGSAESALERYLEASRRYAPAEAAR